MSPSALNPVEIVESEAVVPAESNLTQSQYLIWLGQQLTPDAPLYNMAFAFDIFTTVDVAKFASAFAQLVLMHDSLRTVIDSSQPFPRQCVLDHVPKPLELIDMSHAEKYEVDDYLSKYSRETLNLSECIYHSKLITVGEHYHIWFFSQHHIACDVRSFQLLYDRLQQLYTNESLDLSWPQFEEYRKLEYNHRQGSQHVTQNAYWKEKLNLPCPPLQIYRQIVKKNANSARVSELLGPCRSDAIKQLAEGVSGPLSRDLGVFALLAASTVALLFRLSGNRTIRLGVPFHNRTTPVQKQVSGLLLEILVLKIQIDENDSINTLAAKVLKEFTEALLNSGPGVSQSRINRSFQVLLNYIPLGFSGFCGQPGRARWLHCDAGDPNHHLRLQVHDLNFTGDYQLDFDFNTSAFDDNEQLSMVKIYQQWITQCLQQPNEQITSFDLLDQDDYASVVHEYNGFALGGDKLPRQPTKNTILDSFEQQVRSCPDDIAIESKDKTIRFRELNQLSNNVAARLTCNSSGQDRASSGFVVVCLPRSIDAVVAILGVLKTGAAFVPVDPLFPDRRTNAIVNDLQEKSKSSIPILTYAKFADRFSDSCRVITMETGSLADFPNNLDVRTITPGSLAYIMYTSGSTGAPKGVMVSHAALLNYISWAAAYYIRDDELSFALHSSLNFDLTITSLFLPLVTGNRMIVYPQPEEGPDLAVLDVFEHNATDFIKLTPSHLSIVPQKLLGKSRLKRMVVGGEAFSVELARRTQQAIPGNLEIYNEYGPTEATVGCMHHRFDSHRDIGSHVPIGKPAQKQQIYLLDEFLKPVPPGIQGQIYIGGAGLAQGYLNNPEETAERFIDSPFVASQRLYRSGDLGYFDFDGNLNYAGRVDEQLKVKGVRIEPGEIEAAMHSYSGITECAVVAVLNQHKKKTTTLHCQTCGISSNYPGIRFDDHGVCNICCDYELAKDRLADYFGGESHLITLAKEITQGSSSTRNCVALVSGGKDSTYMLYRLVELGLTPVVFTLDNGFLSDQAKRNIENVASDLGLEQIYGQTDHMNKIFADSLTRFSNVCNGCFKTIYTLSMQFALQQGISTIFTGLSRGQLFETRLQDFYNRPEIGVRNFDNLIKSARKAYHRMEDAVSQCLDTSIFNDDTVFEKIEFVDFYRYIDVSLDSVMDYLEDKTVWIRPEDTGRSTNCRINDVGIYMHKRQRGFHNYELPYSWDVRIGHKNRAQTLHELNDEIDQSKVESIMQELGVKSIFDSAGDSRDLDLQLAAYYVADKEIAREVLVDHMLQSIPANMVPAYFVRLDVMPKSSNGKIDRQELKQLFSDYNSSQQELRSPRTTTEKELLNIWQEVFYDQNVTIDSNFFDLGGDSMTAIQIVHRAAAAQLSLSADLLFQLPTIAYHADQVKPISSEPGQNIFTEDMEIDIALSADDIQQVLDNTQKSQI